MLEKDFERNIANVAVLMKCKYFKIPDTKMINKNNRGFHKEQKRPFDGILVTPNGIIIIEAKIGSVALKPHQLDNIELTNKIKPNSAYVVRKFDKYIRIDYHNKGEVTKTKVNNEKELIDFFLGY